VSLCGYCSSFSFFIICGNYLLPFVTPFLSFLLFPTVPFVCIIVAFILLNSLFCDSVMTIGMWPGWTS
jgi:hypothetical protein